MYGPGGLLDTHSSYELSEWMAYERVAGPIGPKWDREIAAQMHELTQFANHLLGAQLSDDKHPNQVPKPTPVPRMWDGGYESEQSEVWATFDDEGED